MPQAYGDPEELNKFANILSAYIQTIQEQTSILNCSFAYLGDTWQDEKRMAFEEEYIALTTQIAQFESECAEFVPYLHTLAARLQDYLQS